MKYPISEIFYSIQGEWRNTWKPSVFVRFWGCNAHCTYCDSKYSWQTTEDRKFMTIKEIIEQVRLFNCWHIIFTWWEPTLYLDCIKEIQFELPGHTYEIETNGSNIIPEDIKFEQINISPKLKNSWNNYTFKVFESKNWEDFDFKFVVWNNIDIQEIEDFIQKNEIWFTKIWIMPEWITRESQIRIDLAEYCKNKWYNLSLRMHLILFGNKKGV